MIVARPILVLPPPPRPLQEEGSCRGCGKEEVGQEMTYFGGSQSNERGSGTRLLCRGLVGLPRLHGDAHQKGIGQHHEGQVTIPAQVTAHFILIQTQIFGGFQVFFDVPACAQSLYHRGKGGRGWSKDEEISQLVWIVQATAKDEEVAAIHDASLRDGKTCPIKETFAFRSHALRKALPITSTYCLLGNACHISHQKTCTCLHTHDFDGGHA